MLIQTANLNNSISKWLYRSEAYPQYRTSSIEDTLHYIVRRNRRNAILHEHTFSIMLLVLISLRMAVLFAAHMKNHTGTKHCSQFNAQRDKKLWGTHI